MSGVFVTFEGGEGSGKTTQLGRLAAKLRDSGLDPLVTREPGGTPLAERVRGLLLDREHPLGSETEAFLIEAARSDLVRHVIRPALEAGRIVLCDRFTDSTLAYQGGGRGLDGALLAAWNRVATGGLVPDLTLLYDVDPAVGLARRTEAGAGLNRLDRESHAFHERVRARYLELARGEATRIVVLDGALPPDELEATGWRVLAERVQRVRAD